MRKAIFWLSFVALCTVYVPLTIASSAAPGVTPQDAMQMLKEGNDRFSSGAMTHPNQNKDRRTLTNAEGQHPFATILGCSDSRVPLEVVFDMGIGDLFVVRVAGNVVDTDEAGSIEYGVDHLGTPILVVLGHTKCGAVTAVAENAKVHGNIPPLVSNIKPAVTRAKAKDPKLSGSALVDASIKANVWQSIEDLIRVSPTVRERIVEGKVKVVGALYDLQSGKVEWLGTHPDQVNLIQKYGRAAKAKKH